jgi:protein-tyrosine phosphatase
VQQGKILVHCLAGVSRSATIVIAYLMKTQNLPFEQAYEVVRQKREFANPNQGFRKQLEEFYKKTVLKSNVAK